MKNALLVATDGIRLAYTSTKNRIIRPKKYSGNTEEICRSIIADCFDKKRKYYRVSPNNFRQFYARDFGMCCESLIKLGYKTEVKQTLAYAMSIYEKEGKITTQITPFGVPADFPSHTPESASYMLNSLLLLNDRQILDKYKNFFAEITEKIYEQDIDKETGLLKKEINFSSMKDHSLRESDCYNNCLLGLFAENLKKIGLKTKLSSYNYSELLKSHFLFNDKKQIYFLEDLSGSTIFASDANTFPFWTKLFDCSKTSIKSRENRKLFSKIIQIIRQKEMDYPWPLKYTTKEDAPKKMHITNLLVPGYEKDTLWMHLGLCYMKAINDVDKKLLAEYLKKYEELILKNKTFHEVFDSNGKVFSRLLYKSDEAMLWCSIFLELYLENKKRNLTKEIK